MTTESNLIAELDAARLQFPAGDLRIVEPLRKLAEHYCEQRYQNRARPLVLEIWNIQRKTLGNVDRQTVTTLSWFASILASTDRIERAKELLLEFVKNHWRDDRLGAEHRASVMNQLVELYYKRSQFDDAELMCHRVLRLLEGSVEPDSNPDAVRQQLNRARNNLGALHVSRGQYRDAQRCFTKNLRDARRHLSPGDPSYVVQLTNLAALLRLRGRIVQSERLTIRAIRQCSRAHGWYHPLVAQGMSNLGAYRLQGGRPQSAESLFRKALKIRRRLHPPADAQVCRCLRQLAEARLALGKHSSAERLLERTRTTLESHQPVDEVQLAQTLCSLGFVYLGAGRLANCERTLEQTLQLQERALGPQNSQLIQTLNGLGCLNAARANFEQAQSFHVRALELSERHLGMNHPELAKTLVWLGEVALSGGRLAEAETALNRALSLRESSLGTNHPLVAEVLTRVGQLALAQGHPARALSLGARARGIYRHAKECPPLAMADVLSVAGEASRRLHRYRSAETIIIDELKLREQVVGRDHISLLPAIRRLASVFMEVDAFVEAEEALRRGLGISEKAMGIMHENGIYFAEQLGRVSIIGRNFEAANAWIDRTVKMYQRRYGDQAEEVAVALLTFANCLRQAKQEKDANDYEQRAIELRNRNCHVLL